MFGSGTRGDAMNLTQASLWRDAVRDARPGGTVTLPADVVLAADERWRELERTDEATLRRDAERMREELRDARERISALEFRNEMLQRGQAV
jgi:hypothetical protein